MEEMTHQECSISREIYVQVVGSEQKDEMQKRHAHKEFMLHQKEREAFIEKLRQ